ncbi:uncharacterized protein UTRI_05653 [Ustilago trichophora]|uniref:Uncharacterized protein n=1 Tax=Ustilago trichophora TaxID=86804 RepID=A0A5C3EIK6_9BASI|nr:uncharacterized protein UTRI_05653 [Ustilago trichophora]
MGDAVASSALDNPDPSYTAIPCYSLSDARAEAITDQTFAGPRWYASFPSPSGFPTASQPANYKLSGPGSVILQSHGSRPIDSIEAGQRLSRVEEAQSEFASPFAMRRKTVVLAGGRKGTMPSVGCIRSAPFSCSV